MKKTNYAERLKSIQEFGGLLQKYPKISNPHVPESRFVCINQLNQAVNQKKGRYTEEERQDWLNILFACLKAPNCYFENEKAPPDRTVKMQAPKYEAKFRRFQQEVVQDRNQYPFIYTYLSCIRDLKKEDYLRGKKGTNNLAKELQAGIQQLLNDRISQRPNLEKLNVKYKAVLKDIFQEQQEKLNHPVFFLFLPYYLSFRLGQCEGLILSNNKDAFSLIELSKNGYTWAIPNSPFAVKNEADFEEMVELYDEIETSLCMTLCNCDYHSIGESFLLTDCHYMNQYRRPGTKRLRKKDVADLSVELAAHFSMPLLSYNIWIKCFCEQYDMEAGQVLDDINRVFNLMLRASSAPAKRTANDVLQKYGQYCKKINGKEFSLIELLKALCSIYNPQYFNIKGPFRNKVLRESVNLLMDFLVELDIYSTEMKKGSADEKWLWLLRYGLPTIKENTEFRPDDVTSKVVNPNRILYRAITMRFLAKNAKMPSRYILSSFYQYSESVRLLSNALYYALNSEKAVLHDMAYWGGVKVELDDNCHSLTDAFRVWFIWNKDDEAKLQELCHYLKDEAESVGAALSKIQPFHSEPAIVDIFDSSTETDENLWEQKRQLFWAIPKLDALFNQPDSLDDFRYACILYFLFRTLRNQMCYQASVISTKLLQLA